MEALTPIVGNVFGSQVYNACISFYPGIPYFIYVLFELYPLCSVVYVLASIACLLTRRCLRGISEGDAAPSPLVSDGRQGYKGKKCIPKSEPSSSTTLLTLDVLRAHSTPNLASTFLLPYTVVVALILAVTRWR